MATEQPVYVYDLISDATKRYIGTFARLGDGVSRSQWKIFRPPFVTDEGQCMLLVSRQQDGAYIVTIGRQGMCADIYTEAKVVGVAAADVDSTVLRMCKAQTVKEASGGR